MLRILFITFALLFGSVAPVHAAEAQPVIQIAILLDTSNSMDGLIDQAKSQLWKVVNEFVAVKRDGRRPLLQVALFEYGNNRLVAGEHFVRKVTALTDDLDKISQELFALKATQLAGSEEYPGAAIAAAVDRLEWSKDGADLKVIYVAGNEAFDQGPVDFRASCKTAITKGIQVNTIYCGSNAEAVAGLWKDAASLADGTFMSIDHNAKVVEIAAPQDKELAELGGKLNGTYVPFGGQATAGAANQKAQDANTAGVSEAAAAQRAVAKGSANYRNGAWCLVDRIYVDGAKLDDIKAEELPENMRKMSLQERKAFLEGKKAERENLRKKIGELNDSRAKYVAEETRKQVDANGKLTLDKAVIESIRKQAEKKDYKFEK